MSNYASLTATHERRRHTRCRNMGSGDATPQAWPMDSQKRIRIRVSEKVFAAIWALWQPGLATENDILEHVFKARTAGGAAAMLSRVGGTSGVEHEPLTGSPDPLLCVFKGGPH